MTGNRWSLGPGLSRSRKVRLVQAVIVLGMVAFVEFAPRLGWVGRTTLIPLSEMVGELVGLVSSGEITPHVARTFGAVLGAFLMAMVAGTATGVVLWRFQSLNDILEPYLLIYYAIPFFAFYPLLIAIFGLGITPILLIAFGFSVVIIVTNTASGLEEIPDQYVQVGRDLNLTNWQLFRYVYFPAAVPYLFTGLKLGFIYALIGTIASEFILADGGLGWLIAFNYNNFDIQGMYAAMLLVVLLALVVNGLLSYLENRLYRRVRA